MSTDELTIRDNLRRLDAQLSAGQPAPSEDEIDVPKSATHGIADQMAALLAKIKPSTPAEIRAADWQMYVIPRLKSAGIPARYWYELADWHCPEQERVFHLCRKRFTGVGAIVALVGVRGTGKTTIAAQLIIGRAWEDVARMRESGFDWRWTPYRKLADLLARYKSLYSDHGSTMTEELTAGRDALLRSSLLILDECHDAEELRLRNRMLTDLLDRSYSGMKDVLLISNEKGDEFEASAGASIISRIREHGLIVDCEWTSWREGDRRALARHG